MGYISSYELFFYLGLVNFNYVLFYHVPETQLN